MKSHTEKITYICTIQFDYIIGKNEIANEPSLSYRNGKKIS